MHGIHNENLLHVLPFHDLKFSEDSFDCNLNSLRKKANRTDWDVFKKRRMHFIHINTNSLLQKIDELRYVAKKCNASIIWISKTKLDEALLSSELEVNGFDLIILDQSRRGFACLLH